MRLIPGRRILQARGLTLFAGLLVLTVGGALLWQWHSPGGWLRQLRADQLSLAGLEQSRQGRPEAALALFDAALAHDSWQRDARWQRVQLSIRQGRADIAFLHLTAYVELFPEDARGWMELAQAMRAGGVSVDAEEVAGRAVEAAPLAIAPRLLRAELRLANGRLSGAGSDLAAVLEQDPEQPQALVLQQQWREDMASGRDSAAATRPADRRRGQFWPSALGRHVSAVLGAMGQQRWEQADQAAQAATQAYPGTMFGPWLQAVVALNQGQHQQAEDLLREALRWAPRSQRVLTLLTQVWARSLGVTQAADRLLALVDEDPAHELPWTIAAQAFIEARQPSRALAEMRDRLALPGAGAIPYRRLVDLQQQLDDPAAALGRCREGLLHHPRDKELAGRLPALLARVGQTDAARSAYEAYLAQWPDDHAAVAGYIHLLLDTGAQDSARVLAMTDRLSRDYPSDALVLDAMARARLALGEVDAAQALADAAVRSEPGNASYIFRLGSIRAHQGDRDGALRAIDRALAAPGRFPERIDALQLRRRLQEGAGPSETLGPG